MTTKTPAGLGRKRPQLNIPLDRLHLDVKNPRLPEEAQNKPEDDVLIHLFDHFDLEEISDSMVRNGYFDEEPLVAVPKTLPKHLKSKSIDHNSPAFIEYIENEDTEFVVAEGNRRLATAKLLTDAGLRRSLKVAKSWPTPSEEVADDLSILPVIIYKERKDVLPYLGVRHITGNKKWDSYAKARYINEMIKESYSVEDIEQEVGDRAQAVRKSAIAFNLLRQAQEELDYGIENAKEDFSLLLLAVGSRPVKKFLGWQTEVKGTVKSLPLSEIDLDAPVDEPHLDNLHYLLRWLFGEGSKTTRAIHESRDITGSLKNVLESEQAIDHLKKTGDLREAYELTDGEEAMVKRLLLNSNRSLERALSVAHRHRTEDVIAAVIRCEETVTQLKKSVMEE
ncbi:MAG: hypothetical protein EPO42_13620 [Gallionellaceae bacterium]|nr:MAG: hypothetical protein EPO42_13620 [Gallionellaceae bacterium]